MKPVEIRAQDIHSWAEERIRKQHLPLPAKPKVKVDEYAFPEDLNLLSSAELSQWSSRFGAWAGYCTRLLGLAESELLLVESEYKLAINSRGVDVREKLGRVGADVVEAEVLKMDGELTPIYKRRLELLSVKAQLDARLRIYDKAGQVLSRELSRRELEARLS